MSNQLTQTFVNSVQSSYLLISSSATDAFIFSSQRFVFGVLPTQFSFVEVAFKMFSDLGARSIAVIEEPDWSQCNYSTAKHLSIEYNFSLSRHYFLPFDENYTTNLKRIMTEMKALNIQTILGCSLSKMCNEVITYSGMCRRSYQL